MAAATPSSMNPAVLKGIQNPQTTPHKQASPPLFNHSRVDVPLLDEAHAEHGRFQDALNSFGNSTRIPWAILASKVSLDKAVDLLTQLKAGDERSAEQNHEARIQTLSAYQTANADFVTPQHPAPASVNASRLQTARSRPNTPQKKQHFTPSFPLSPHARQQKRRRKRGRRGQVAPGRNNRSESRGFSEEYQEENHRATEGQEQPDGEDRFELHPLEISEMVGQIFHLDMRYEADVRQSIERLREAPSDPFNLDGDTELDVSEDLPDAWSVPQLSSIGSMSTDTSPTTHCNKSALLPDHRNRMRVTFEPLPLDLLSTTRDTSATPTIKEAVIAAPVSTADGAQIPQTTVTPSATRPSAQAISAALTTLINLLRTDESHLSELTTRLSVLRKQLTVESISNTPRLHEDLTSAVQALLSSRDTTEGYKRMVEMMAAQHALRPQAAIGRALETATSELEGMRREMKGREKEVEVLRECVRLAEDTVTMIEAGIEGLLGKMEEIKERWRGAGTRCDDRQWGDTKLRDGQGTLHVLGELWSGVAVLLSGGEK